MNSLRWIRQVIFAESHFWYWYHIFVTHFCSDMCLLCHMGLRLADRIRHLAIYKDFLKVE